MLSLRSCTFLHICSLTRFGRVVDHSFLTCCRQARGFFEMSGRHPLPEQQCPIDWDPMLDDYSDPAFNYYNCGPGARLDMHLQPWNPRREEKRVYKMYIPNIPVQLTIHGLHNYFVNLRCAPPLEVFINPALHGTALTWGFVYYNKLSDAEHAIHQVSGMPPLFLRVRFARSEEDKNRLRSALEEEDRWKTSLAASPYAPTNRDLVIQSLNVRGIPSRAAPNCGYYAPVDPFYDDEVDGFDTPREDANFRMNQAIIKCSDLKILPEGSGRRVSMGRGFFVGNCVTGSDEKNTTHVNSSRIKPSETVSPHSTELPLSERIVRLFKVSYEFGTPPEYEEGPCNVCHTLTTKHCGFCEQWYCSRDCQRKDWKEHKLQCQNLPPLNDSKPNTSRRPEAQNGVAKLEMNASFPACRVKVEERPDEIPNGSLPVSEDSKEHSLQNHEMGRKEDNVLSENLLEAKEKKITEKNLFLGDQGNNQKQRRQDTDQRPSHGYTKPCDRPGGTRNFRNNCRSNNQRPRNHSDDKLDGNRQGDFHQPRSNDRRGNVRQSFHRQRNEERYNDKNDGSESTSGRWSQPMSVNRDLQDNSGNMSCNASWEQERSTSSNVEDVKEDKQEIHEAKKGVATGAIPKDLSRMSAGDLNISALSLSSASGVCTSEVLPAGIFSEVKVVLQGSSTDCWVQLKCKEQDFLKVQQVLFSLDEDSPKAELKVGSFCASKYDGLWFRTKVLTIIPEIRVQYIDYGNTEVVQDANSLKLLPTDTLELPQQAIKICLAEGTSEKCSDLLKEDATLFVKPSKVDGDVVIVHVRGYESGRTEIKNLAASSSSDAHVVPGEDTESQSKTSAGEPRESMKVDQNISVGAKCAVNNAKMLLNSSVILLKCGMYGFLEYQVPLENDKFIATIGCVEFAEALEKVTERLGEYASSASKINNPQPRDLVLAKNSKTNVWLRAYVISSREETCLVAFCDSGELQQVNEIKELQPDLMKISGMAVQCSILEFVLQPESKARELLTVSGKFRFEVISTSDMAAEVFLKVNNDDKPFCKAKLSSWQPQFRHNLKCVPLVDGPYVLTHFHHPKDVVLRPVDKSSLSLFRRIMQDLAGSCHKVDSLGHVPSIGDLVAGKYSGDGNYYRALVRSIDEKDIKVTYVDFGNSEVLHLDNLKPLSEELQSHPCFAVRVKLNDVLNECMNKEVSDFYTNIVMEEAELKLKVIDVKSKSVSLYLPNGTCISEKVNELLEPSWKKHDASRINDDIYLYDEMTFVDLPLREVKLGVQQILAYNRIAVVNMEHPNLIESVQITMAPTINNHCTEIDQNSYVPLVGETCLANYEGEWFRAVCLRSGPGPVRVMFIDYGNVSEVEHTNVRKMVKEFFELPALTSLCIIKGIDDASPNRVKILERLKALLPLDSILSCKVLAKKDVPCYDIELPLVISTLNNEGLL